MRLDYALFNQHLANSREKAKALVLKNQVLVNKMVVSKPSFILETTNRWSRAFLLAFNKLDYLAVQEAKLELDAYSLGKIVFNFAYQVPLPQF
ncbi:S4 domain-containing protein [Helicobacter pylori]|uniref:S4 domain-containing protein n=1 Tax=Helicobacter pylori TaxID=210 RepID=UPI000EAB9DB5|nr:S4 domain-containing protein [Helicobacter pylori]